MRARLPALGGDAASSRHSVWTTKLGAQREEVHTRRQELDAANELRRALGAETARAEGLERERNRAKRAQEASDKKAARRRGSCEELEDRVLQLVARIRTFSEGSSTL